MTPQILLQSLKHSAGGRHQLCLVVGNPAIAVLRPVATNPGRIEQEDVRRLTEWRNRHVTSFLTEFKATTERTTSWLTRTVGPDDTRILFMVDDLDGHVVGYMGLAFIDWTMGSAEADAVVRGEETPRGLMTQCLGHLLAWAKGQLGLAQLSVRVRSDNPALAFYRKFGFVEVSREPLAKTVCGNDVMWNPATEVLSAPELNLVHMILRDDAAPISTL